MVLCKLLVSDVFLCVVVQWCVLSFRGSAIAKIIGHNVKASNRFDPIVKMWVYEEMIDGRKLTEIINTEHENVKYLPGHKLPKNVVCVSSWAFTHYTIVQWWNQTIIPWHFDFTRGTSKNSKPDDLEFIIRCSYWAVISKLTHRLKWWTLHRSPLNSSRHYCCVCVFLNQTHMTHATNITYDMQHKNISGGLHQ